VVARLSSLVSRFSVFWLVMLVTHLGILVFRRRFLVNG
jgi:hypothetical protein